MTPFRLRRAAALVGAIAPLVSCSGGGGAVTAVQPASRWVAAWGAASQHPATIATSILGSDQTFRTILKPSVGGHGAARLHLSNFFGTAPVTVNALRIGIATGTGAAVTPGTERTLTFGGQASVTIPAGGDVSSDAVPLQFPFGTLLATTMFVAGSTTTIPGHNGFGQIVDYASASGSGDEIADDAGTSFQSSGATMLIDHLDLFGDYTGTIAVAGSSTSAGFGAPGASYTGMIDELADDLHAAGRDDLAIANMSMIPDSLLAANDVFDNPSVLERLSRDFLSLPSIRTILQNAADIDLKSACDPAPAIIAGDQSLIAQAHASGVRVVLAVIAPSTYCQVQNPSGFGTRFPAGSGQDGERDRLNSWIASTAPSTVDGVPESPPGADGVVDISTPVTDPANTGYLLPADDAGDDSHANAAGQAIQAAAIPASVL